MTEAAPLLPGLRREGSGASAASRAATAIANNASLAILIVVYLW